MKNGIRLLALLVLAACGPTTQPEGTPSADPAQDTASLTAGPRGGADEALVPPCDTVRIDCPYGGSVGCSVSDSICFAGQTFCSVICGNVEHYCPGTSKWNCPSY